jgi:hypothetical protein
MAGLLFEKPIPYPPGFPESLGEYREKAAGAIRDNTHHQQVEML